LISKICCENGYTMEFTANVSKTGFCLEGEIAAQVPWWQLEMALAPIQRLVSLRRVGYQEFWQDDFVPGTPDDTVQCRRRIIGYKHSLQAVFRHC
jgi:hypothetical protein